MATLASNDQSPTVRHPCSTRASGLLIVLMSLGAKRLSGTKQFVLFLIGLSSAGAHGSLTLGRTAAARLWLHLAGLYFLVAAHFTFPNHGGFGLELPANPVAWMFIASWIGIGFWHWTTRKSLRYSTTTLWFMAGVLVLALPQFYPWAATEDGAAEGCSVCLGDCCSLSPFNNSRGAKIAGDPY